MEVVRKGKVQRFVYSTKNRNVQHTTLGNMEWIKTLPSGPYTTMRTYGNDTRKIFKFDDHWDRVKSTFTVMNPDCHFRIKKEDIVQQVRDNVTRLFKEGNLRITLLIEGDSDFHLHFMEIPERQLHNVRADAALYDKKLAIKTSDWVKEREKLLIEYKDPSSNELILCESDGSFREGLSSNVFIVSKDGCLETASDNIIKGTVRNLVLEACEKVPELSLKLQCPNIQEIENWSDVFITSTSRIVMPIHQLHLHQEVQNKWNLKPKYEFPNNSVPILDGLCQALMEKHSQDL